MSSGRRAHPARGYQVRRDRAAFSVLAHEVDRAPLGDELPLYSSAVKPASALAIDEASLLFLHNFAGLNACSGDLVPGKALRSDRFRQRLKLSGGYEAKLLRAEIKGCYSGRCCAACCKGEHDQRPHYVSFPFCTQIQALKRVRRSPASKPVFIQALICYTRALTNQ